jgi:hypothetical protein
MSVVSGTTPPQTTLLSMFSRALKRLDGLIGEINAGLFAIASVLPCSMSRYS